MDKVEIVNRAFAKACKYLREHPPADGGWDGDMTIIRLLVDAAGDPDGKRWMAHFINEAMLDIQREERQ